MKEAVCTIEFVEPVLNGRLCTKSPKLVKPLCVISALENVTTGAGVSVSRRLMREPVTSNFSSFTSSLFTSVVEGRAVVAGV